VNRHLKILQDFRRASFECFGDRAEFSDAVWFATWSGGAPGGRLARYLLGQYSTVLGMLFFFQEFAKTIFQALLRSRKMLLEFPAVLSGADCEVVIQSWKSFEQSVDARSAMPDRFFGNCFQSQFENGKLLNFNILTDNVSSTSNLGPLTLGRSLETFSFCVSTLCLVIAIWIKNFWPLLKLLSKMNGVRSRIAASVVWACLPNQRSRHAFELRKQTSQFLRRQGDSVPPLFLPYETQPEQLALAQAWKENGGRVTGYLHGTMLTFPGHYICPQIGQLDEIWIHGNAYFDALQKCGWDKDLIKKVPAFRFRAMVGKAAEIGAIYFPYWSGDLRYPLLNIKSAVQSGAIRVRSLKPHPSTGLPASIRVQFEQLIQASSEIRVDQNESVIGVGPISVVLEELERATKFNVLHAPISSQWFDSFDNQFWQQYLDCRRLPGCDLVELKLKSKNAFIDFEQL